MVETISPVVHGGRTPRYWVNLSLHTFGAVLGSAAVGVVLGAVGRVAGAPWNVVGASLVVVVGLLYAIRDLLGVRVPLPDLSKQVPEWWRTFFPLPVTSVLYGLGLGLAFFTSLSFGTFVVVSTVALASGDPLAGGLICAPFGLGRGLAVATGAIEHLAEGREQRLIARTNGAASLLVGAAAAASALL